MHNVANARRSFDDLLPMPLAKCLADAFACYAGHGGEVAMGDPVPGAGHARGP